MEIEEMQAIWSQMSDKIDKQKMLTNKMIMMMTKEQYRNKLNKIAYPEKIGAVVGLSMVLIILLNIDKLDNWYTLLCGALTILVIIAIIVLSMKSIYKIGTIDVASANYKETVLAFARQKKNFQKSMKLGYYLCFVLMLTILPVTTKIIKGKDLFEEGSSIWPLAVFLPVTGIALILVSKKIFKYYNKNINAAELLIQDIEDSRQ